MKTARIFVFCFLSVAVLLGSCTRTEEPVTQEPLVVVSPSPPDPASTLLPETPLSEEDRYQEQRLQMVRNTIEARGITDDDVLRAMRNVPRHRFVPVEYLHQAYQDHPLPIGYGQTISQPFIVAWMTELVELQPGEAVLEIGTGSGYQAAVLAELEGVEVYSIEIVPELAERAEADLRDLGYTEVQLLQDDGYFGWPDDILFDAILVTAAPDHVPAPLASQLKEGGRMVIPIGPVGGFQTLWKFVKEEGELVAYNLGSVRFVPLVGGVSSEVPIEP
jgi:protein-L-isoaspartate(D-aspartate) O-methyltransferase